VVSTQHYDALGRTTSVWLNSRPTTAAANYKFSYQVSKTGVTAATAQKMNDSSGYQTSVTIYDALLRTRQTQAVTPQGGRMITDTFYDTRGWARASYNGWWESATTPNSTLVSAADLRNSVPNQTFYTYDGLGRVVIEASAKDGVTVSTTTAVHNGDRTTVIPPTGGVVKTNVTDPLGRTTELQEYTATPTLTTPANTFTGIFSVTGGTATASRYSYDGHGNRASSTDAQSNTWTSTFNLLGQLTAKVDPDAGSSTMAYDGNGNVVQSTDGRGKTVSYAYDKLDRKTGAYFAPTDSQSTANQVAAWVFDNADNAVPGMKYPIGKLTTATAYSGGQAYTSQSKGFNVFGNSLGVTVTIPSTEGLLSGSYDFTHTYTSTLGLPLKDGYPNKGGLPSETLLHGYSGVLDLPTTLSGLNGYAQGVTYDAYGRVNQQTIGAAPNLAYVTNGFDEHTGRLKRQLVTRAVATPTNVDEQTYHYDLAGNILKKASTRLGATTPSETQCFGYDKLARLTEAWTGNDDCAVAPTAGDRSMVGNAIGGGSAYWTSWQIDAVGNRTKQTERNLMGGTDTTTTYTYGGAGGKQPHILTSTSATGGTAPSTSYTYDTAGNTITRNAGQGNQTLTWNDGGDLTSITGGATGNSSYVYAAEGDLLLQKDPGKTTLYLPGQQLTLNTATNAVSGTRYYGLPGGGSCIRTGSGSSYTFAIADHQGTPTLYLNNTAQTPTWRQYTPYGAPRGTAATYPDNRGFLNKPTSPDTGLTIVGARAYDPMAGRFISVDPLMDTGNPQQWNGYAYANNSPVTLSDPSGLSPEDAQWEYKHPKARNKASKDPGWNKYGCPDNDCSARDANGLPARLPVFNGKNGTKLTLDSFGNYYLDGYRLPPGEVDVVMLATIVDDSRGRARSPDASSPDPVRRLWAVLHEITRACLDIEGCGRQDGAFFIGVDTDLHAAEDLINSGRSNGSMSWQQALIEIGMAVAPIVGTNRFGGARGAAKYDDVTEPNSRFANRLTDVGHEEFGDILVSNGWSRSMSKDGNSIIFQKDGAKYAVRSKAKSYDGWTAEFTPAGVKKVTLKIRLGG
jgi:RHS repeat-associated protein